jgi:3-dehydroquinate synthetase
MNKILKDSSFVDQEFAATDTISFSAYELIMPVPEHHPRAVAIAATRFLVQRVASIDFPATSRVYVDTSLSDALRGHKLTDDVVIAEAREDTLKELSWLTNFIHENAVPTDCTTIVGIGGGVLLNAVAYIAERQNVDFISVPTTVLAAADSAIGGLVRINKVEGEKYIKSFYKSVYEPSSIIIDVSLLASLPKDQIRWGLSEVVKHGVYQSLPLLEYLAGEGFNPFGNENSLVKAICWTAALKNVAIIHDPDSTDIGGLILRGGHQLALHIEEASNFRVSHGEAVAVGIYQDSSTNVLVLPLLDTIYAKLELPKSEADLN